MNLCLLIITFFIMLIITLIKSHIYKLIVPSSQLIFHCLEQKTGKWCAAHVRMAWEIHRHQQSHLAVNSTLAESSHRKTAEMNHIMAASANPLRPPSGLLPGVGTGLPPRPGDRGSGGSLIGPSEYPFLIFNYHLGVYTIAMLYRNFLFEKAMKLA